LLTSFRSTDVPLVVADPDRDVAPVNILVPPTSPIVAHSYATRFAYNVVAKPAEGSRNPDSIVWCKRKSLDMCKKLDKTFKPERDLQPEDLLGLEVLSDGSDGEASVIDLVSDAELSGVEGEVSSDCPSDHDSESEFIDIDSIIIPEVTGPDV
jgi:hypothetical protein